MIVNDRWLKKKGEEKSFFLPTALFLYITTYVTYTAKQYVQHVVGMSSFSFPPLRIIRIVCH